MPIKIEEHPQYNTKKSEWELYRITLEGGSTFIEKYLKSLKDEDQNDFTERKELTYNPGFAAGLVSEVTNSIYQRLTETIRTAGPDTYRQAVAGELDGVDLSGSTMDYFMGVNVLTELANIGKVGIYIDSFIIEGQSVADKGNKHPYLYVYKAEDIINWRFNDQNPKLLDTLLLRDSIYDYDVDSGLPKDTIERYRLLRRDPVSGLVTVQFFDKDGKESTLTGEPGTEVIPLQGLTRIPFVILELSASLLKEVARYQKVLLNVESSDIFYILRSNIPYYIEKFDEQDVTRFLKTVEEIASDQDQKTSGNTPASVDRAPKAKMGVSWGRRIPNKVDFPQFIAPPVDNLEASMKKQDQIRDSMRILLNLTLSNVKSKSASAESKNVDVQGMEAGLSYIGLELQTAENSIGQIWSEYEGSAEFPLVRYPEKYDLKTEEDRRKEAEDIDKLRSKFPSITAQKVMLVEMVKILLSHRISVAELDTIEKEIEASSGLTADIDSIKTDHELGLVSTETASKLRGYNSNEWKQAAQDHAERLMRVQTAQQKGMVGIENPSQRGIKDQSANPGESGGAN